MFTFCFITRHLVLSGFILLRFVFDPCLFQIPLFVPLRTLVEIPLLCLFGYIYVECGELHYALAARLRISIHPALVNP